jgi:hypothetical protein
MDGLKAILKMFSQRVQTIRLRARTVWSLWMSSSKSTLPSAALRTRNYADVSFDREARVAEIGAHSCREVCEVISVSSSSFGCFGVACPVEFVMIFRPRTEAQDQSRP